MGNSCHYLSNIAVIRVTADDVARRTDTLHIFAKLLETNESMYPDIKSWIRTKVLPGLRDNSRSAFLTTCDGKPIATAIVKRGNRTKFCHLRIDPKFRNNSLGEMLFVLMAFEVRGWAQEIHFTLPESLWTEKADFFRSFGFYSVSRAADQYRLFDEELKCSAPFPEVWNHVLERISKIRNTFAVNRHHLAPKLVLSVKPKIAEKIIAGEKTVEIRTRFSERWVGKRLTIYAGGGVKGLVGEATIKSVAVDSPARIWEQYADRLGCEYADFVAYSANRTEVYALELSDITPYAAPMPLTQMEFLGGVDLKPPQSYLELHDESPWTQAVSIAALLHAQFRKGNTATRSSLTARE